MRPFNISVLLTANSSTLRTQLHSAARDVQVFGNDVDRSSKRIAGGLTRMQAGVGIAAVAIGAALGKSVQSAVAFETQLRNVNSIAHLSEQELRNTGDAVLELSRRFPQSAETLAAGLYDIASSGFQGSDGLRVLEESAVAASAGMTDTATAARGITSVLNAYGLEAEAAGQVSDVLFQTVNLGVVTFEELANTMGDFVGTTAAAGIGIAEANAALAAMTLTGISASEAGTSLNRVVQSLIKPSEALKTTLLDLGYAQGTDMLAAEGLTGTMEKLRKVTGGNVNQLLALFPEIRAARGAFALMSDEGRTYVKVSGQIEDSNARLGAAKKALAEQTKGLGYQFEIARNNANALFIEAGTNLLPTLKDVLSTSGDLAGRAWPYLVAAGEELLPIAQDLWSHLGNLVEILGDVLEVAAPVAGALAGLAVVAVVETLGLMAATLETVSGFLADNTEIVGGLAAMYAVTLLPALYATATGFAQLGLVKLVLGFESAALGAKAFSTQLRTLAAAHPLLLGLTVAIGAATAAFTVANNQVDKTSDRILALAESQKYAVASAKELYDVSKQTGGFANFIHGDAEAAAKALAGAMDDLVTQSPELAQAMLDAGVAAGDLVRNADGSYEALDGLNHTIVLTAADAIRLEAAQRQAAAGAREHEKDLLAQERQLGRTRRELGMTDEEFTGYVQRWQEAGERAGDAFAKANDAIAGFTLETGKKAADAGTQLTNFYDGQLEQAASFAEGLREAARRGLDPSMIQKLLEAGPAAAAPILEGMLADNSGKIVTMVNRSERALREFATDAVQMGRLTQLALEAKTDTMAGNLGTAMDILEAKGRIGGRKTAGAIADELGIGARRVARIAAQYGIDLAKGVNPVLKGLGESTIPMPGVPRNAGGIIPGSRTHRDTVAARLTPGEFVAREAAVDYYGPETFYELNAMRVPREVLRGYNTGGYVTPRDVPGVPNLDPYQSPIRPPADASTRAGRGAVVDYLEANAAATNSGAQGLDAELLARFNRWDAWAQRTRGIDLGITSGWRSRAQQAVLYDRYLRGQGPIAAKPGTSKHERGLAIDYNPASWALSATARQFGLMTTVSSEPWHVEKFSAGGLVPRISSYDRGGPLYPGWTLAHNGTGRVETVSTHPATRRDAGGITAADLERLAQRIADSTGQTFQLPASVDHSPKEYADEVMFAAGRRR